MKFATFLALLFSLVAVGGVLYVSRHSAPVQTASSQKQESVYDRVIRTGVIRCAYADYTPFFIKDPNTGVMSGIFVDIMDHLSKSLDLKVEWTEEVGWGQIIEGLESDRYDAFCADMWSNATRSRQIDFSIPISYSPLNIYVRNNDTRFDTNLSAINSSDVRISTMDGEMGDLVARHEFPNAARTPVPQTAEFSELLLNVTSNKADVVISEPTQVQLFEKNNPGQLKNITSDKPIRIFPNDIAFRRGQDEFKAMLNGALTEMMNDGEIDEILKKYETVPGVYFHVAYPYRAAQ